MMDMIIILTVVMLLLCIYVSKFIKLLLSICAIRYQLYLNKGFPGAPRCSYKKKNMPANAGGMRDTVSIPWLGSPPGVGNGNLLQYSCLQSSMDRRDWQATVHGVAKHTYHMHTHKNT